MDMYSATEQAYKNGYDAGCKDTIVKMDVCTDEMLTDALQVANRLRNLECCERGFMCDMMWNDVYGPVVDKAAELLEMLVNRCKMQNATERSETNWGWNGHMR